MAEKTMKIKVHEQADLFSEYDPDQEMLSEDMIGYIIRCYQHMKLRAKECPVIQIQSDTPVNEEEVAEKIRNNFRREIEVVNRTLNKLFIKAACLGIFGVIILSIWIVLSANAENVNIEILSIVGWVAIWEMTNILLIECQTLQHSKWNMNKVIHSKIDFLK
jgi:hypothetical protein